MNLAHAWTSPVNITNQPDGSRAFGSRIAKDPLGNTHMVWVGGPDNPSGLWQVWYQLFNGASWSPPVALSGLNANRPDLAVDGNGTVHVVYEEAPEKNIWYRNKPSNGNWTAPVNLRTGGRSIIPKIAINPAGNRIIVAWHEDSQVGGEWDIFVNIFNGTSWAGTFNVSSNASISTDPKVCIDTQGNMHVAWNDTNLLHRKRDFNGNWGPITPLFTITARAGVGSLFASSDGFVHCGYTVDDGSGNWRVWYKYYNGTWSNGVNVYSHAGATDDIDPEVYADSFNRVYMVWHDYNNIFFSTAANFTSNWAATVPIVSGKYLATGPVITIDTGLTARVAWQSRPTANDNWDVFVSTQSAGSPGPQGTLAGEVRDQFNQLVPGATVSTGSSAGITNANGQYSFPASVGTFTVTAGKQYFNPQSAAGVVISQNATTTRNFVISTQPPAAVTGFQVTSGNQTNALKWTNPGSGQFTGTMIRFRTDSYPLNPTDGTLAADIAAAPGSNSSFTHASLTNGTIYYYAAFAHDNYSVRSFSAPALVNGRPFGPADFDHDGDVDQADFGRFQACYSGSAMPQPSAACASALMDNDEDVDLNDFAIFQSCISGAGVPADPHCNG